MKYNLIPQLRNKMRKIAENFGPNSNNALIISTYDFFTAPQFPQFSAEFRSF